MRSYCAMKHRHRQCYQILCKYLKMKFVTTHLYPAHVLLFYHFVRFISVQQILILVLKSIHLCLFIFTLWFFDAFSSLFFSHFFASTSLSPVQSELNNVSEKPCHLVPFASSLFVLKSIDSVHFFDSTLKSISKALTMCRSPPLCTPLWESAPSWGQTEVQMHQK